MVLGDDATVEPNDLGQALQVSLPVLLVHVKSGFFAKSHREG